MVKFEKQGDRWVHSDPEAVLLWTHHLAIIAISDDRIYFGKEGLQELGSLLRCSQLDEWLSRHVDWGDKC